MSFINEERKGKKDEREREGERGRKNEERKRSENVARYQVTVLFSTDGHLHFSITRNGLSRCAKCTIGIVKIQDQPLSLRFRLRDNTSVADKIVVKNGTFEYARRP